MIIQLVRFETELSQEEVIAVANERIERFRALPGLVQKYYVKLGQLNHYGGIYIWDSRESMTTYRKSELAASIAQAYKVKGTPTVEVLESLFALRE